MHIRFVRTLLFALVVLCMSAASLAQIGVMITIAPPALPVYEQPVCPADGYIWTPGYWAYGEDFGDYYWVPGTWVEAPEVGFFWTPGYWGWNADRFVFTEGYWGPEVGFYGGINYGFGYFGNGYEGGRWDHDHFFYNRAVNNVNVTVIHNVYNTKVVNVTQTHVSYNGGNGGISARATSEQETAARGRHIAPVAVQTQHMQAARGNTQQRASVNRGKPEIAATDKPGDFNGRGVVKAKEAGGKYTPPPNRGGNQPRDNAAAPRPENNSDNNKADRSGKPVHAADLPAATRPSPTTTGDAKRDQKLQQQQAKQTAKQEQERQKLQQRQQQEDQKVAKPNADAARKQQIEQRHQQQTERLQQKHEQQQQKLQQKQQPANRDQPKPEKK